MKKSITYLAPINKGKYSFTRFKSFLMTLDEQRKQRLKLNRISVTADLFHDRADVPGIAFDSVMEADFIFCLRSLFMNDDYHDMWFPLTLIYKNSYHNAPFEIFSRAESPRHFQNLKQTLHIESKKDLISKIDKAYEQYDLRNWRLDYQPIPFSQYMNLDKLYDA